MKKLPYIFENLAQMNYFHDPLAQKLEVNNPILSAK